MIIEITKPELEALIHQHLQSGVFHDVDDLLTQALGALDEKAITVSSSEIATPRHISDVFREIMSDVPAEVWETMPTDGASEHDHYLYGWPKRNS